MATEEQKQLYRLTDIETEEVSVVDRAANKKKFLVVKRDEETASMATEIKPDGKGGAKIAKAPEGAPAPDTTTGGEVPKLQEPKLQLSAEIKGELAKRLKAGVEKAQALIAQIEGAEEVAGAEIPQVLIGGIGEILNLLANGETVEKSEGAHSSVTSAIAKGRKQISIERETALRNAHAELGRVLAALEPEATPAPDAPAPEATEKKDPEPDPVDAKLAAIETKLETLLAKGLGKIADVVAKQNETIAKTASRVAVVEKGVEPSQAGPEDTTPVAKSDEGAFSWSMDLAAEAAAERAAAAAKK